MQQSTLKEVKLSAAPQLWALQSDFLPRGRTGWEGEGEAVSSGKPAGDPGQGRIDQSRALAMSSPQNNSNASRNTRPIPGEGRLRNTTQFSPTCQGHGDKGSLGSCPSQEGPGTQVD